MSNYKKIFKGSAGVALGPSSLYTSDDHLLFAESGFCSEKYRRFYFKDIQALAIKPTGRWSVINLVIGVLAAILLLIFLFHLAVNSDTAEIISYGIVLAILSSPLIINLIKGRTGQLTIQTKTSSVATVTGRIKKLDKLVIKCSTLITEVQGDVDQEELLDHYRRTEQEPVNSKVEQSTSVVEEDMTAYMRPNSEQTVDQAVGTIEGQQFNQADI